MRIVSESTADKVTSVVNAVRKDKESWKDWRCMKFEMLTQGHTPHWSNLHASVKRLLEIYLQGRQGTVFLDGHSEIHIFCKDVSEALLETMGRQITDLVKSAANIAAIYRVYELYEDHDGFIKSYDQPRKVLQNNDNDIQIAMHFHLPETDDGKTDALSRINGRKVLLVEDDPVTRWMVKMALKDECRLAVAPDASKALAVYDASRPDMVLLDINLPGSNGQDVMASIMDRDPGAHIVMFSSHDSLENMVETIEGGAKAFIAKPFNKQRLVQCVQNCPAGR